MTNQSSLFPCVDVTHDVASIIVKLIMMPLSQRITIQPVSVSNEALSVQQQQQLTVRSEKQQIDTSGMSIATFVKQIPVLSTIYILILANCLAILMHFKSCTSLL